MKLDKFEEEELKEEVAKLLTKRIYLPDLQKMIADRLVNEFVSKLDNDKFLQECIKKYNKSVGHRLGRKADMDLYHIIIDFGKRIQRLELKVSDKGELRP